MAGLLSARWTRQRSHTNHFGLPIRTNETIPKDSPNRSTASDGWTGWFDESTGSGGILGRVKDPVNVNSDLPPHHDASTDIARDAEASIPQNPPIYRQTTAPQDTHQSRHWQDSERIIRRTTRNSRSPVPQVDNPCDSGRIAANQTSGAAWRRWEPEVPGVFFRRQQPHHMIRGKNRLLA